MEDEKRVDFHPYLKLMIYRFSSDEPDVYHSTIIPAKVNQEYVLFKFTVASHWDLMD
jgi:hypothetical protein